MGFLRYDSALEALLVTKGHPFARDAFFSLFESWPDIRATAVEQPAAQAFFSPEAAAPYDAIVLYDMPGIEFRPGAAPRFHAPPAELVAGFRALLEAGKGFVFLHHAIAGWPAWEEYAEVIGGRFLYAPGRVRGASMPDSGYRLDVRHRVHLVDPDHPVVAGVEDGFEIEDELYLYPVFEEDFVPLLRADYDFDDQSFYSAARAIEGSMSSRENWSHPPGRPWVGWARRHGRSPIVYLAAGDGPGAYGSPAYRRLVENAIRWVASDAARAWAAEGSQAPPPGRQRPAV